MSNAMMPPCLRCGCQLRRKTDPEHMGRIHQSRGLCKSCAHAARRNNELDKYPKVRNLRGVARYDWPPEIDLATIAAIDPAAAAYIAARRARGVPAEGRLAA